ncbi:Oligopeptide-binding protein AppA [Anaerolineae bacterium]|nr:Oligopeptide-binding protein AppA [Anaerolineae bacterium]
MRKPIAFLLTLLLLAVLAACAAPEPTKVPTSVPAQATQVPPPTKPPEATKPAEPTKPPAPTTAPTVAANAPKRGGKITIALWQSPTTLSTFLGAQTVMNEVLIYVVEGLTREQPDGSRAPVLAKEVPTVQNGGVSADGKTITYKLKEGILWSDGTPFTCEDVKFTWQVWMTPGVGITSTAGYSEIDTIECPNPTTAIVKYKNFYGPYITLFPRIAPKSAGDPKNIKNWEYNRKPMGTGPFKVQEWVTDDHITLVRNENYRDAKAGQPYLDQIIVRIVPSVDVGMQLIASGEIDVLWSVTIDTTPQMDKMPGVKYSAPPRLGGERIIMNLAENKDPADPTKPHQIMSDVKVRQALALSINKQRIVDQLLYGKVALLSSELNTGPYACDNIKPYPYDLTQAKKLLDDAGWIPGPDGIRVSKGAKYAPDGTRLRLKYSTTSGNKLREDTQALVLQDFKAIGVEAYVENAPSATVIGNWAAKSPRQHGNFDLIQYSSTAGIDPHAQMAQWFGSANIPSEKNQGGTNIARFSDPKVDDWLKQAEKEPDMDKRRVVYCQIAQQVYDAYPVIYLYQAGNAYAYRDRLQGWLANGFNSMGWNAQDWWIK